MSKPTPADYARAMYPALRALIPPTAGIDPTTLPATFDECSPEDRAALEGMVAEQMRAKGLDALISPQEMSEAVEEVRAAEQARVAKLEKDLADSRYLADRFRRETYELLRAESSRGTVTDPSLAITALLGLHNAKHGTPAAKRYLEAAVKLGDELAASILAPR